MITLHLNGQIIKGLSSPELEVLKFAYEQTEAILDMSIQQLSAQVNLFARHRSAFLQKAGLFRFR